ncbi:MAG: phosphoribosyltransferase family protein [Chloroflexota bacterium]|nr:phosphoribosyltransferase family protein [Dehalococcoidia bacterium]MDW8252497.1 phosphoribosyltransferase family protein [Chloroflexota bacterium]
MDSPHVEPSGPRFSPLRDRQSAGAQLATALASYAKDHPVVLAIPPGGVPVAAEIAHRLGGELNIIVAQPITAPGNEAVILGAVTASGESALNDEAIAGLGVSEAFVQRAIAQSRADAQRREEQIRGALRPPVVRDRTVIIVDDGVATAAPLLAAVRAVRQFHPARVVVAVPVGEPKACRHLEGVADDVLTLVQPAPFHRVADHYQRFDRLTDADAAALVREHAHPRSGNPTA